MPKTYVLELSHLLQARFVGENKIHAVFNILKACPQLNSTSESAELHIDYICSVHTL